MRTKTPALSNLTNTQEHGFKRDSKRFHTQSKSIIYIFQESEQNKQLKPNLQGRKINNLKISPSLSAFSSEEINNKKSYPGDTVTKKASIETLDLTNQQYPLQNAIAYSFVNINHLTHKSELYNEGEISPITLKTATQLYRKLYSISLKNKWWWYDPLVNISGNNEIVLEWWNQSKKITIYVSNDLIDYIKVWGPDMDNEMEDGSISTDNNLTSLWQWIAI